MHSAVGSVCLLPTESPTAAARSLRLPWDYLALFVLTLAAYLPLWHNGFVNFDDEAYLTPNPDILGGLNWSGLSWAWANDEAPYWIPVTWMSFQFDAQFFSERSSSGEVILWPLAVHTHSLLWHVASVLLLYALWYRLTAARGRSLLVAALFAVHPMHVESVAWAFERKDVLSGFFGILTVWLYVDYVRSPGRLRYLAVATAYFVSLLAKPMLMTLPIILLLLDYWPLRRMRPFKASFVSLIREKVILFTLALAIAASALASRDRHGSLVSLDSLPLSQRLIHVGAANGWYVGKSLWPTDLAVLYPHPADNWSVWLVCAGTVSLLGVTAGCVKRATRQPALLVGWLWFVITLLPVTGLAQGGGQAWADRFSYWPHIGLFVALVWAIGDLVERWRIPHRLVASMSVLVIVVLASMTWAQVGYWQNSITLWEHTLAVTSDNYRAHQFLSLAYRREGNAEPAQYHCEEAYRIQKSRFPKRR